MQNTSLYPPFVWPEPSSFEGLSHLDYPKIHAEIASCSKSLFGVLSDIDGDGVNNLAKTLEENNSIKLRILIVVYPACVTDSSILYRIISLTNESMGRVEFRLLIASSVYDKPINALCYIQDNTAPLFTIGGMSVLGAESARVSPNFTFYGDDALLGSWSNWFNWAWSQSVQLDSDTASIPALMPVQGTEEADRLWQDYWSRCHRIPAGSRSLHVEVNEHTGKVEYKDSSGESILTPAEELGCKTLDAELGDLVSKLEQLYRKGALVTIDKTSRLKPFDTPINPRWFGMDSLRKVGSVTRTVSYRISAFDEKTLKDLNNLRKRVNDLLPKFTFPISDGVRWMPNSVRDLFFTEMKRSGEVGQKRFKEICGSSPEEFVNNRKGQIEKDANRMYQELHPFQTLDRGAMEKIVDALNDRVLDAANSSFAPKVSFSNLRFEYHEESDQTSTWGQPLELLHAIAEFPRKCVADHYFMRGLSISLYELLTTMNVLDDAFVRDMSTRRAETELYTLEKIMGTKAEPHKHCLAILKLIDGRPYQDIVELLPEIEANTPHEEFPY